MDSTPSGLRVACLLGRVVAVLLAAYQSLAALRMLGSGGGTLAPWDRLGSLLTPLALALLLYVLCEGVLALARIEDRLRRR